MKILITGIPGVGKTTIAKNLSKHLKLKYFCDKQFINKNNSIKSKEYGLEIKTVDLENFCKDFNKFKKGKDFIIEGLLLPYCLSGLKINFDYIFILNLNNKELIKRLKKRKYPLLKIEDNLFIQDNDLILKEIANQIKALNPKQKSIIINIDLKGNLKEDKIPIYWFFDALNPKK